MQYVLSCPALCPLLRKIAVFLDIKDLYNQIRIFLYKYLSYLTLCPKIELSLLPLAVGILPRIEPTGRRCHVPEDVSEYLPGRSSMLPFARSLKFLFITHFHHNL